MIGIQICMLKADSFQDAGELFAQLQARVAVPACEIHLERSLYPAAFWPWDSAARLQAKQLRSRVARLGVHLPFVDLNPIASNSRIAETSYSVLESSIECASAIGADYVVFHARSGGSGGFPDARDLPAWQGVLKRLGGKARDTGVRFCLENADDLRDMKHIASLLEPLADSVALCLDLGHLFERKYPEAFLQKALYRLNDRLSPFPFFLKGGLPAESAQGWPGIAGALRDRIACVHLHDHDGLAAHRRLRRGKIDFSPIRACAKRWREIPVILEADYAGSGFEEVVEDLRYAEALLS